MPNQAHSGWQGTPWHICDRCGRDWPTSQLRWQRGVLVCPDDYDNPLVWEREGIMQAVIDNSPHEMDIADVLRERPGDETDQYR